MPIKHAKIQVVVPTLPRFGVVYVFVCALCVCVHDCTYVFVGQIKRGRATERHMQVTTRLLTVP